MAADRRRRRREGRFRTGEFPHDLLHAFGGMTEMPLYRDVERLDFDVNVLAVEGELIGNLNQLVCDDPADSANHRDRK